jgi:hypothetical protein
MSLVLSWDANPPGDNVLSYTLSRAPGLGALFSAAVPIFTGNVLTHADTTVLPLTPYTYFLQATNAIGVSAPDAGVSVTTAGGTIIAAEALAAGAIVNVFGGGSPMAQNANATDGTKPATGFVLAAVAAGAPATVLSAGQLDTALSGLTPGTVYWLGTSPGTITTSPPSSAGNLVQQLGITTSATALAFNPQPGVLV